MNNALVVTLYIDIMDKEEKKFRKHLDHHLKSDNWIKQDGFENLYFKNSYIADDYSNIDTINKTFNDDMQEFLNISTNKDIVANTTSEKPMRGIIQLGNFGHTAMSVTFDASSKKYTVHCDPFKSYGEQEDVFAAFE